MNESVFVNATTDSTPWRYQWSFVPAMEAVLLPCVIVLNTSVLALLVSKKRQHIPFNVYLTGVLISNLFFAILDDPLDILNFISPYWWLGNSLCTMYLYALNIPSGIVMYSHILITTNRIWAVTFPHSYRRHHSAKIAVFLVVFIWLLVHVVYLPGVLMDAFLYRLPIETSGCILNIEQMPVWNTTAQFVTYTLPNAFIILAYPYLVLMRRRKRRVRVAQGTKSQGMPAQSLENTAKTGSTAATSVTRTRRKQKDSRAFAMFTALTLSIIVCWTPLDMFYTVWCFVDLSSYTTALQFCQGLFVVQPALDPIYFAILMPGLRSDIVQFCRKFRIRH